MNNTKAYEQDNIFKKIIMGQAPCFKVYEDQNVLAFMDIFPESKGHVLVVPKLDAQNIFDIPAQELGSLMTKVQKIAQAVSEALNPDGIKIMQYNGAEASQTVFHLHFHIVPCYAGLPLREHNTVEADKAELQSIALQISEKIKGDASNGSASALHEVKIPS